MQINELPIVISAPPIHIRLLIGFLSMIIEVIEVMTRVKEFVNMTQTESEHDFLCNV